MEVKSSAIMFLCGAALFGGAALAQVQKDVPRVYACYLQPEEIRTLSDPLFGGGTSWDFMEAGEGMDVFADAHMMPEGKIIVAGSLTKDKKDKKVQPFLAAYDDKFKKIWTADFADAPYRTVTRVLPREGGYVVAGDVADKDGARGFYLALSDGKGKISSEQKLFEAGGNITLQSIVPSSDAKGYMAAVQFTDAKNPALQHGLLYKLGMDGNVLWKRAYKPGTSTVFRSASPTLDRHYIVTGQIVSNAGDKASAWVMKVDNNGAIAWQRTFPRGQAAVIANAAPLQDGGYILTGQIRPHGGGVDAPEWGKSGWVMKVDAQGAAVWQRYFRSLTHDYIAGDTIAYEDGRISVLMNGAAMHDDGARSYARIVTFSALGGQISEEDYVDGQNAKVNRMVSGPNGERVLIGFAQTSFAEDPNADDQAPPYTYDGWVAAVPPLEIFEDPCVNKPSGNPILP